MAQAPSTTPALSRGWPFATTNAGDHVWAALLSLSGGVVLVIVGIIVIALWDTARPALHALGVAQMVAGREWDPVQESFGALPFLYGTLLTSALAILIALPVGLGLAIFVTQLAPRWLGSWVAAPVSLLAAIPSVVYGLWGLFVLIPVLRGSVEPFLGRTLGWLPLFQGPAIGPGYLAGGLILAIMILPTVSAVSIEVLRALPGSLKEAALALGATRWEAIRMALLPPAVPGLLGATLLGLGRALGETMAVTMVIGNSPEIHASLFAPGYSLPAVIANEFAEATGSLHTAALAALALILFGVTLILNAAARLLVRATRGGTVRGTA